MSAILLRDWSAILGWVLKDLGIRGFERDVQDLVIRSIRGQVKREGLESVFSLSMLQPRVILYLLTNLITYRGIDEGKENEPNASTC